MTINAHHGAWVLANALWGWILSFCCSNECAFFFTLECPPRWDMPINSLLVGFDLHMMPSSTGNMAHCLQSHAWHVWWADSSASIAMTELFSTLLSPSGRANPKNPFSDVLDLHMVHSRESWCIVWVCRFAGERGNSGLSPRRNCGGRILLERLSVTACDSGRFIIFIRIQLRVWQT